LIELINELEPYKEKIEKLKIKLIEDYAEKDQDGNYKTKSFNNNQIYEFGENEEKVNEELQNVMNTDVEIKNKINKELIKDIEIEPFKLKILFDKNLIK
jgi:hypothetical protein